MANRLSPLEEPYPEEIASRLAAYPQRDGYILKLFRTFANSSRFLGRAVANLLDKGSPLGLRRREIAILRTTANLDCEYEWGVHVSAFAKSAGLTDEQVAATRLGSPASTCWTTEESLLIRAIDDLCRTGGIGAATYSEAEEIWSLEEQLEIIAICGNYHTISFVANTAQLDAEPFAARFPRDSAREVRLGS
jgi:alkylhydroperoxidase family enzyme